MTQTTRNDETLGNALADLSSSADGLGANVRALKRSMNDLETSTERLSERQGEVSESLARAAEQLAPSGRDQSAAVSADHSSGFSAVADD